MLSPEHKQAQELAAQAALLLRDGHRDTARDLYSRAADLEVRALSSVPRSKPRTWGVLAVSAAALLYKARRYTDAEALLHSLLQHQDLAPEVRFQLRDLLDTVWDEQTLPAGYEYSPNEILVSLRGGSVGRGTAPLDAVLTKAGELRSLVSRALEWGAKLPFRKHGAPPADVLGAIEARITQPQAGSYRFTIRLAAPAQVPMFPELERVGVTNVADSLFRVVQTATSGRPDSASQLRAIVPDPEYRVAMLKLLRSIVPSGKQVGEVDLTRVVTVEGQQECVTDTVRLYPQTAVPVREMIRADAPTPPPADEELEVRGVLRAVHLEEDWLAVLTEGKLARFDGAEDMLDDVVGPMVNKPVIVRAQRRRVRGVHKLLVIDIEADPDA